ncbi:MULTISPECIES: tyrosine-type recombinase/integrase [unclassified Dehalobacter]|jgi:site-specific recombinase XerD|uniref:tyrosine-type recombinase/integrase n=1 Tax=unclassified Dehalobacter TaxID=2635733 RepID=UPI000E6B97D5|nr:MULTISPECIES: tyrosine-type recombinase/integrase [unclassified Dehalobacter]RJE46628.1 hypothetical protein A7K50_12750 [Dehalobacter sp. MCB1]TCX47394.1 integrase [Dehalobacter sp. 14DCB1]TCX55607.1 integrase [Dehalobacter sp. 12DCB1]
MKLKNDSFFKSSRDFLTVYLPRQRKMSPNTVKSYKGTLNQFVDYLVEMKNIPILQITLDELNAVNVSDYLDWLQESKNAASTTRNQKLMALRSFAKYCSVSEIANVYIRMEISNVPIQKVPGKKVEFLSEDAMRTLLSMPDMHNFWGLRNGMLMILMYDTAARCQEILDIKLKDIVFKQKAPYVYLTGKGEKLRSVPLMEKTIDHLKRYMQFFHPDELSSPEDYLFYTVIHGKRNPMSPDTVSRVVHKYGLLAKKGNPNVPEKIHPHMFRHTRAIHLYRSGVPLPLLSEYLGHSQMTTTSIYAYASMEMKAEAISKANNPNNTPNTEKTLWEGDAEMIKQLYCLK